MDILGETMKFKPLYFYGILTVVVVVVLIIVTSNGNSPEPVQDGIVNEKNMPNDDIHSKINSNESPNKDNVSQEFKHRMEMLKKAVDENPNDTTKLKQYADLLAAAHMQKQSLEYYDKILSINPDRVDILFSASFANYSIGNFDKAEKLTKHILDIDPESADAQYNLGAISATKGDKEKAREIWQKLADKYPDKDVGIKASNSIKQL